MRAASQPQKGGKGTARGERHSVERVVQVATLAAVGLVLSYVESMIPLPVAMPGIKLGLSNVAVLVCLYLVDARSAALVALVKVVASGFLFGSPAMIAYSAAGTFLAYLSMLLMVRVLDAGEVATSMVAAIMHDVGQVLVAALALSTSAVLLMLPPLAVAACVTGALTGMVTRGVVRTVRARGPRPEVASDVDLEVAPGELVAFVGRNGSGKTSFALQWAAGMNGRGGGDGRRRDGAPVREGPRAVGFCFQDPDDQCVSELVEDDVAFCMENRGADPREMRARVPQALRDVGLDGLGQRRLDELSGGQRRKATVAGLLVGDFDCIVFDEPTAMLDPASCKRFFELVEGLRARGYGIVLITQRIEEALRADRVCVFSDECLVACERPDELVEDDGLLARAGIALPPVVLLSRRLRASGVAVPLTGSGAELGEALCR